MKSQSFKLKKTVVDFTPHRRAYKKYPSTMAQIQPICPDVVKRAGKVQKLFLEVARTNARTIDDKSFVVNIAEGKDWKAVA